jgi:hypothetical protein
VRVRALGAAWVGWALVVGSLPSACGTSPTDSANVPGAGDAGRVESDATGESTVATDANAMADTFQAPGDSGVVPVDASGDASGALLPISQGAYIKASNTQFGMAFGRTVALSADGTTMVVGAPGESSGAMGVNGNQGDMTETSAGAAYVFVRAGTTWSQQAYVKASNPQASAQFGTSVALSADGNTLAIGASSESSAAMGINGMGNDTTMTAAGAAYVFVRTGATWAQTTYVKASNTAAQANFGFSIVLSADGTTLVVGARSEATNLTGINGDTQDAGSAYQSGAAYVFALAGGAWSQQAYVKASDTAPGAEFGYALGLSTNGDMLVVGAPFEKGSATGIDGSQSPATTANAGAVYAFTRSGGTWSQAHYIKASNTGAQQEFGTSVALSPDGLTLAVGAPGESSKTMGVGGDQSDTSLLQSGAAYVFASTGTTWSQQAYVKPSDTQASGEFGDSLAISGDGSTLVAGARGDASDAKGVGGMQTDMNMPNAGAAFAFTRAGTTWSQIAYIKASNTRMGALFGNNVALSTNASTMAIASVQETSKAMGINGDQSDTSLGVAGAVYAFQ